MATIAAAAAARTAVVGRPSGVAQLRARRGERVRCGYSSRDGKEATPAAAVKGATSMLAAAVTASSSSAPAAMALVDPPRRVRPHLVALHRLHLHARRRRRVRRPLPLRPCSVNPRKRLERGLRE
ncbi:Os05g0508900 [Oryza sativa Japonica Group]|uniref:Os05g0508900 protein n=3 Tax=Oryza sativa TaxID=4530 RepID=B9FL18_ORYSJ|nr:unknown protein [Oryza sativa Japonica Group]EEC79500.1 hypothetical protein OsI_20567 [Oryza sativa Indica Group]KAB8100121.1 hypothetical protein EE612_030539 [Oryza sativa]EEE64307.1 hypothetical protein OsJ_19144 [Oryza sativa Japonica Group]BAF17913.1 Os05g0508900 [Oryza sativa Japonica Group]|eukprot:NP_001055999.1 Os05g0508900 [Oryza sativa Japonica Group]